MSRGVGRSSGAACERAVVQGAVSHQHDYASVEPNNNNAEPAYTGPTVLALNGNGFYAPTKNVNGAIKCQQVSGGDGYSTMANGTQTFMFSFGPLSGLADIAQGHPGTEFPATFNTTATPGTLLPGDPATTDGAVANTWPAWGTPLPTSPFNYNGAVGLAYDTVNLVSIYDIAEDPATPRHAAQSHGSNQCSSRCSRWRAGNHFGDRDRLRRYLDNYDRRHCTEYGDELRFPGSRHFYV